MKELLVDFTQYNLWANRKFVHDYLLKSIEEIIDAEIESSFPSLRKTVYHIADAEQVWILRLKGKSVDHWPSKDFTGSFPEFCEKWISVSEEFAAHALHLDEHETGKMLSFKNLAGIEYSKKTSDMILHCMNHSTYHRGQIVTMLRQLGFKDLSSTDYITFKNR